MESDMTTENHCVSSTEPIRCAIYARTATQPQLGNNSIEQQIEQCREAARLKGWTVVETHIRADCGKSGTSMDQRTGLHDLMALAATRPRPFDYIICDSTDRLTRSLSIAVQIIDTLTFHGINLYLTSNALDSANPNFHQLFYYVAEQDEVYLKCFGDKIRRGMMGPFLSGYHPGARCFGYTNVPETVSDPQSKHDRVVVVGIKQTKCDAEAKVIERIFEGYVSGLSLAEIAMQLNADGVPPPQGRAGGTWNWSSRAISRILGNEKYIGKARWNQTCKVRNPATGKLEGKTRPKEE